MTDTKFRKQFMTAILIVYAVFGFGMIIGTFFDLQVDMALMHYSNRWGVFMERFGMLPADMVQFAACAALVAGYHSLDEVLDFSAGYFPFIGKLKHNKAARTVLFVLHSAAYVGIFYLSFEGSNRMWNFIFNNAAGHNLQDILISAGLQKPLSILIWTIVRLVPVLLLIFALRKVPKDIMKDIEYMALVGLLMLCCSPVINALKRYFNRVRFREMIAYSHGLINADGWTSRGSADIPRAWIADTDFSSFTRWYKVGDALNRYSEPTSFPSGHTTAASYSFLLIPLFAKNEKLRKYFIPAFIIGFGYTLNMGISRLVRGAHYLTDISSAALIMFTIMLFWFFLLDFLGRNVSAALKKKKKK